MAKFVTPVIGKKPKKVSQVTVLKAGVNSRSSINSNGLTTNSGFVHKGKVNLSKCSFFLCSSTLVNLV